MSRSDNSAGLILASSPFLSRSLERKMSGVATICPLISRRGNSITTWPVNKAYLQIQPLSTTSKVGPSAPLSCPLAWMPISRSTWKSSKSFKNLLLQMISTPIPSMRGFIDLTSSLNYFIPDPQLDRRSKLDLLSARIQKRIWQQTGIYATVGMSNANPLLAKLALDNEAKHQKTMRANWSYEDVPSRVWQIKKLTDFWGLAIEQKKRLSKLGIHSIYELAHANPDQLKKRIWSHGRPALVSCPWDRWKQCPSPLSAKVSRSRKFANPSSWLPPPKRYWISLSGDGWAGRYPLASGKEKDPIGLHPRQLLQTGTAPSIHCQRKIEPTNSTAQLARKSSSSFVPTTREEPSGRSGVFYGKLVEERLPADLFIWWPWANSKEEALQETIDHIRDRFGFASLQKGSALLENSRALARSKLTGGHSAGGLDGLAWSIVLISPISRHATFKTGAWPSGPASSLSEHSTALQTNHLSLEDLRFLSIEEIRHLPRAGLPAKDLPLPL